METKFCWTVDEHDWMYGGGMHPTREAALAEAKASYRAKGKARVWTGECVPFSRGAFLPDAETLLQRVREDAEDQIGDAADDYPDVTLEGGAELDALLKTWAEKHMPAPRFYDVAEIEAHDIQPGIEPGIDEP